MFKNVSIPEVLQSMYSEDDVISEIANIHPDLHRRKPKVLIKMQDTKIDDIRFRIERVTNRIAEDYKIMKELQQHLKEAEEEKKLLEQEAFQFGNRFPEDSKIRREAELKIINRRA